jgi:hypothetical protein
MQARQLRPALPDHAAGQQAVQPPHRRSQHPAARGDAGRDRPQAPDHRGNAVLERLRLGQLDCIIQDQMLGEGYDLGLPAGG